MTEPKPDYITKTTAVDRLVYCQNCGAILGRYIRYGDRVYIEVAHLILSDAWGECLECRASWIWHSSDKCLDDLIHKVKAMV